MSLQLHVYYYTKYIFCCDLSGCVEAILASLEANPSFPEHVLAQALRILDRLCDHKKSLLILVRRESIRSLIQLLQGEGQRTEVLGSCLKGMAKLTRGGVPPASDLTSCHYSVLPVISQCPRLARTF